MSRSSDVKKHNPPSSSPSLIASLPGLRAFLLDYVLVDPTRLSPGDSPIPSPETIATQGLNSKASLSF